MKHSTLKELHADLTLHGLKLAEADFLDLTFSEIRKLLRELKAIERHNKNIKVILEGGE